MKWQAIIEVESSGFKEARCLGGPFASEEEAVSWATRYMDLAFEAMHMDRIAGRSYSIPWGYNSGRRTAYPHDARCKFGIRTPPHCTLYA